MATDLPPDKHAVALKTIHAWRLDPDGGGACPVCGAAGLAIVDHSARPYSEWYALTCAACGLDAKLAIPMAGPAAY